jgi:hypothetical protein
MSDNVERSLGQIEGKLDGLHGMLREHMDQDSRRFEAVFEKLSDHAADINKAKGAKTMLTIIAGGVSGAVAIVAAAAQHLLGK